MRSNGLLKWLMILWRCWCCLSASDCFPGVATALRPEPRPRAAHA